MPRKRTVDELPRSGSPDKEIKNLQEQLRIAEQKIYALSEPSKKYQIRSGRSHTYRFGLSSDWHIGSLYHNREALLTFYDQATDRGVKDFYCAGDVLDGHGIYRGQEFELREVGFDRQIDALYEATSRFPKSAKTHFITGNHDSSFAAKIGTSVGKVIETHCPGMHFIGSDSGLVTVTTKSGDLRIALLHPAGGTAYALSYKSQKIIEAMEGGSKPHILGVGHFHKQEWLPKYRNISAFQAGCFCEQTPFMVRKSLMANVGGWIIEVTLGDLTNRVKAEVLTFY